MSMVSQDACAWDSSAPLGGQLIIFTLYKGNNEFLFMWVSSFGKLSLGLPYLYDTYLVFKDHSHLVPDCHIGT